MDRVERSMEMADTKVKTPRLRCGRDGKPGMA
jgi:hypothetical protein